jgi:hypothetical protein
MSLAAGSSRNPHISAGVTPPIAASIRIPCPIRATFWLAIAFRFSRHSRRLRAVRIGCISRRFGKHRPDHIPPDPSANPCADDPANHRTYRPERRANSGPCVSACQWVQAIGIDVANRVPTHICVNDCPRRPSVVGQGIFARRLKGLRADEEDALPAVDGFCSRGTFWLRAQARASSAGLPSLAAGCCRPHARHDAGSGQGRGFGRAAKAAWP